MKVIFVATIIAFFCYLCCVCASPSPHCPRDCAYPDTLELVSAFKGRFGEEIFISDCGNDFRIKFYKIELRHFKPSESVVLRAVPGVIESTTTLRVDHRGCLIFTIVPTHPHRKEESLDFDFWRPGILISLGVNKSRTKPDPKMMIEGDLAQKMKPCH